MLKKFQHDSDIAKVSISDYGLWTSGGAFQGEIIFHNTPFLTEEIF